MATLESWLGENVETEEYRNRVRSVALGLGDLCTCELEDLEEEGKTSSRFRGVCWIDEEKPWAAYYCHHYSKIEVGTYAEETEAALAYNQAVKDAGLEHKMNPVDANGQPIPKPGY